MGDGRPPRCSGPAVAGWDPLVSSSRSVSSCTPRSDGMPVRERRTSAAAQVRGRRTMLQERCRTGWCASTSPLDGLLDTYHSERHPAGARVEAHDGAVCRPADRSTDRGAARHDRRDAELRWAAQARRRSHLRARRRVRPRRGTPVARTPHPDLDLITPDGPLRVFALLHDARPVLLNLGKPGSIDITPWADRVQHIDADYRGTWDLPVLGAVTGPAAVLIRPDGHVAWAGDGTQTGLGEALTTWFGPPVEPRRESARRPGETSMGAGR